MRARLQVFPLGLFAAALAIAASLAAQEAPTPATPPPAPAAPAVQPAPAQKGIEEIIVTAERREQNIQDVAQSITAFTRSIGVRIPRLLSDP